MTINDAKSHYTLLRVSLALVLFLTASLKLFAQPDPANLLFGKAHVTVFVVLTEFILGVWLLLGWYKDSLTGAAIGFFSVMAFISLYLTIFGAKSCGCFGSLAVSPIVTFLFDVGCVVALASTAHRSSVNSALLVRAVLAATAFLLAGGGLVELGNQYLLPSDQIEVAAGSVKRINTSDWYCVTHTLTNKSPCPINLFGASNTCTGRLAMNMPISLGPNMSDEITTHAKIIGDPGDVVDGVISIISDQKHHPLIACKYRVVIPHFVE